MAVLAAGTFVAVMGAALASFTPRAFRDCAGAPVPGGGSDGVQRWSHQEAHRLEDGSDLMLNWEVDADPDSILELDLHPADERGVRVVHCAPGRLLLEVPEALAAGARKWRHVTASEERHGCGHLPEKNLYHKILGVREVGPAAAPGPSPRRFVELTTEELSSVSDIFPRIQYNYYYMPIEVLKNEEASAEPPPPEPSPEQSAASGPEQPAAAARELSDFITTESHGWHPQIQNSFEEDPTSQHNSMFNLDIPEQVSFMTWNWNYTANTTRNPQFKYIFPGGVGYMRLYKPYIHVKVGLNVSFKSHITGLSKRPRVNVTGYVRAWADFNADIATAVNFKEDKSASVLDNVADMIQLPGVMENITKGEAYMHPFKFYFGGTPVTITPGFNCQLKAYHIGLLRGTLRVGLATQLQIDGELNFDTEGGMVSNITGRALDVRFTPPTWMLFTNHFEMGMMLQPTFWFKGGFGGMQDLEMGFAIRPFFNITIMQQNALQGTGLESRELAIYPWRAVGLPAGKNYVIRIGANGQSKSTTNQMSTGVAEWIENVEDFSYGMVAQEDLIGKDITVEVLEDGQEPPVATGTVVCSSVVNGQCSPSPLKATLKVGEQDVTVDLAVIWQEGAMTILTSKIKSISLRFPTVTISDHNLAQLLEDDAVFDTALLRLKKDGRTYAVPLASKMGSRTFLKSRVIIEMGPGFLDSWKLSVLFRPDPTDLDPTVPVLELVVNDEVVGSGMMPPVTWDDVMAPTSVDVLADQVRSQVQPIPAMVPLYKNGQMVGTGEIEIDVMPADMSAFWVLPFQAQDFTEGETYSWTWTTHGAIEGVKYNFTLTAELVDEDGTLTPTSWQRPVQVACVKDADVPVYRYHGGNTPCSFVVQVKIPSVLVGKRAVLTLLWLDAQMMPHEMLSPPVSFVSAAGTGRRLQLRVVNSQMVDSDGFGDKVKSKLQNLAKHCNAQDLKYALGAGVNFVEHMRGLMLPMGAMGSGLDVAGMGQAPDWTSQPIALWRIGSGPDHGKKLSKLLPNSLCAGGACEGMMPGCQKREVQPINIKQIVFKLSRYFRWADHVGPQMRHIVAYALALLPSALKISEKHMARAVEENAPGLVNNPIFNNLFRGGEEMPTSSSTAPPATTSRAATEPPTPPTTTSEAPTTTERTKQEPTTTERKPEPAPPAPATAAPEDSFAGWQGGEDQGSAFEVVEPFSTQAPATGWESGAPAKRRLTTQDQEGEVILGAQEDAAAADELDGPAWLDGEDVEFDTFTVSFVQPMEYELTEELLRKIHLRGGFEGVEDGREDALGPVRIESFFLRENPAKQAAAAAVPSVELPSLGPQRAPYKWVVAEFAAEERPTHRGGEGPQRKVLSAFLGTFTGTVALVASLLVATAAFRHHRGYVQVNGCDRRPEPPA